MAAGVDYPAQTAGFIMLSIKGPFLLSGSDWEQYGQNQSTQDGAAHMGLFIFRKMKEPITAPIPAGML